MEFNFSYTVFYEEEYLLIVNKPAGMLVHPTVKEDGSTLYNYVAHYYKQQGLLHNIHPVSRLDRNTSGLVIFAKEPRIQFLLSQQEVIKKYLGIVTGTLPADSGIIEAPIARKEGSIIERCVSPNGKYARTDYKLISRREHLSLLELQLHTEMCIRDRLYPSAKPPLRPPLSIPITEKGSFALAAMPSISSPIKLTLQLFSIKRIEGALFSLI